MRSPQSSLMRKAAALASLLLVSLPLPASAGLLWSLQGERNTVYLMGSMHMLPRRAYPLPDALESAFRDSTTVVFETDIDAIISPEVQKQMLALGSLPEGSVLQDLLPSPLWHNLVARSERAGLPPMLLNRFQPWFAANLLALQTLQQHGYERSLGLDERFWKGARRAGKQIGWLESVDEQLKVFADLSTEESMTFLSLTLEDIDQIHAEPDLPFNLWRGGDDALFSEELEKLQEQTPVLYQRIHRDRNRRWVPQIRQYLQSDRNVLIVVGAMHFVGEDGLIAMLRAQGVRVTERPLNSGWKAEKI